MLTRTVASHRSVKYRRANCNFHGFGDSSAVPRRTGMNSARNIRTLNGATRSGTRTLRATGRARRSLGCQVDDNQKLSHRPGHPAPHGRSTRPRR
jgi:hypothetical protein